LRGYVAQATQDKYVLSVEWQNEGDLVVWGNTCVMHCRGEGTFMEKYARDMRRRTIYDGSEDAWGLNERTNVQMELL
jgi:alpha-ketoglutarate-dependent 2,4-dichlorophenoxyacetate dioxygenase